MENKIEFIQETREQLELTANYWFKTQIKNYGLEKVIEALEMIIDNANDSYDELNNEDISLEDYYINMMDNYKQSPSDLSDLIEFEG